MPWIHTAGTEETPVYQYVKLAGAYLPVQDIFICVPTTSASNYISVKFRNLILHLPNPHTANSNVLEEIYMPVVVLGWQFLPNIRT